MNNISKAGLMNSEKANSFKLSDTLDTILLPGHKGR